MTELQTDSPIEPLASSADGKLNAYTLTCAPLGQSMNYAACLWRQNVLATPNVKTPADWSGCDQARLNKTCTALLMRSEEVLAGKSIYFRARGIVRQLSDAAREWFRPGAAGTKAPPTRPITMVPTPKPAKSMLDAMGSAGDLADAISAAAKTPASPPPAPVIAPAPVALEGESPLQMARRLAAERSARA